MSRFLSARLSSLAPYVPGEQPQERNYVKLNTNESPYAPAPGVLQALDAAQIQRLNLYPDPDARTLREVIAARYRLGVEKVVVGNGSDEILAFCFQAYCDPDTPACFPDVTYGFYPVFARLFCVPTKIIPLCADWRVDPADYNSVGGTIFIANPNAPTGLALTLAEIEGILRSNPNNVVVVDEAYVDFGAQSAAVLLAEYDNLVVVQTMSKSRNLAGARVGWALANASLIADLNAVRCSLNPYNLNRLSLLAGQAALEDNAYFEQCTAQVAQVRGDTAQALEGRGFEVLPSRANFLFIRHPWASGADYYFRLRQQGVLVRHFNSTRTADFVRVTIGTHEQMQMFLQATDQILEGLQ